MQTTVCNKPFLSICILSYNRPRQLRDLLWSIDISDGTTFEIVILDDCSPRLEDIKSVVREFQLSNSIPLRFESNPKNCGYDITLSRVTSLATGEWIIYMGDDDLFVKGGLEKYIKFVNSRDSLSYVMKCHYSVTSGGKRRLFRYWDSNKFFSAGPEACIELFRRSVFISGFMVKALPAKEFNTEIYSKSLLTQLYIMAHVVYRFPSAYYDEPLTYQYEYNIYEDHETIYDEKSQSFVLRDVSMKKSLLFLLSYRRILSTLDRQLGVKISETVWLQMSKYSYPSISLHRDQGLLHFFRYTGLLIRIGYSTSLYFYIYVFMLALLGRSLCDRLIYGLRNSMGKTPIL